MEKYGRGGQATDEYTGRPGENVPDFGRMFLKLKYTDIIRLMRIACWITKATDTHSEYVIIIAFPVQHWLRERISTLRFTYIACVVYCDVHKGRCR